MDQKIKKIKSQITPKRIALVGALVSLASFLYKLSLGIISTSMILIVASISTLLVFVCKFIFWKYMDDSKETKKKCYLVMIILALSFGVLFLLFATLKVGGIDTSHKNNFSGWLGYLFVCFVIVMFVLSIIKLSDALQKTDILVVGLKEMIFISALADAVIIQDFLYNVIELYRKLPFMTFINSYFPIITSVIMLLVPILMFKRYRAYEI